MKVIHYINILSLVCLVITWRLDAASRVEVNGFVSPIVPRSPHLVNPLDQRRVFTIYLPDGYDEPGAQFPVIYFGPGLGGDNNSFVPGSKPILDTLIGTSLMVPTIVVYMDPSIVNGIDAEGRRQYQGSWYVDSALNGLFETYITTELIPFVDANYKTKASAGFRAIMGQSMGGYGALFLGTKHPELFCAFGSAGGTTFWIYDTALASPGDPAFTFNSFVLSELPVSNQLIPSNGIYTFALFSYAGAFSPNLSGDTPFSAEFFVNMPFMMNPDGTPVFTTVGAPFEYVNPARPCSGRLSSPRSLVLDPTIVAQWQLFDPYLLMDANIPTMQKQAIYVDAGDVEPFNNVGARVLSDKYVANNLDHEHILYKGGHIACLETARCSRFRTMCQIFSAKFAEAGIFPDDIRVKIVGTGSIIVENGTWSIGQGTMVGIETSPELGVTVTDIAIAVQDNGLLQIGDHTTPGGGLQIGSRFNKALLTNNPALLDDTVAFSLTLDGDNAQVILGVQGFLGLGMGIDGQTPAIPNYWGIRALTNVQNIVINLNKGVFDTNQVPDGQNESGALFALSDSVSYTFTIDPSNATLRGGSSHVAGSDIWNLNPTLLTTTGSLAAGGIFNNLNTNPSAIDCIYLQPMGSTLYYTNVINRGVLATSEQYDDRGYADNFAITTSVLESLIDFLDIQNYSDQTSKEGALTYGADAGLNVAYVDNGTITYLPTTQAPVGVHGSVNFEGIAQTTGTVGILVAPIGSGNDELILVYDLDSTY
jgi:S-formylglutathione hydrolase FrmB